MSVNTFINIITVYIHNLVKIYCKKLHNYIYFCTEFCVVEHIKYCMQCGKKCGWLIICFKTIMLCATSPNYLSIAYYVNHAGIQDCIIDCVVCITN